ncbi:hypothetical protein [Paracidovorax citrulli]
MTHSCVAIPILLPAVPLPAAAVLCAAADGSLAIRGSRGMAWRSALHRLFGIGKTGADAAANRASWQTLLGAIERRGGPRVRERLYRMEVRLAGDRVPGLTFAQRMARGTYLSPAALAQVAASFASACQNDRTSEHARAALMFRAPGSVEPCPLEALFAGIAGAAPVANAGPLSDTRRYVAAQLALAVRPQSAWPAGPALDEIRAALAREGLDPDQLESPALRGRLLHKLDARVLNGPLPGPGLDPAGQKPLRQLASHGMALSAWRRSELRAVLMQNQQEIDALMAAELASPPASTLRSAAQSEPLAHLLSVRAPLLDELHRRLQFEALWQCDLDALRLDPGPQLEALRRRRRELQTCLRSKAVPAERMRDAVRQEQLLKLCRMLRSLANQQLTAGKSVSVPQLLEMADGLLNDSRYVGQFVAARNLRYLDQLARGPDRQRELAQVVRACADAVPPEQRAMVSNDDIFWLAEQLGRPGHLVSMLAPQDLRGSRSHGRATRQWRAEELCDAAAEAIEQLVQRRQRLRALRADTSAPLEERWRACKEGLRDIVRTRELKPSDLAPLVLEAMRPYLQARHKAMRELSDERREADRRMARYRDLFPALASWRSSGTEDGTIAASLFDIACTRITAPLLRIADLCVEAEGEQTPAAGQGWSIAALLSLCDDNLDLARRREALRTAILAQLQGAGAREGVLSVACSILGSFTELWPCWEALRDDAGEVVFATDESRAEARGLIEQANELELALGSLKRDLTAQIPLASVGMARVSEVHGNRQIACDGIDALAAALQQIRKLARISPHLEHERPRTGGPKSSPGPAARAASAWQPPLIGDGRPRLPQRLANWIDESVEALKLRFRVWLASRRDSRIPWRLADSTRP